eukprot:jgi/Botrbrau1/10973/Bobra.0383s0027.1
MSAAVENSVGSGLCELNPATKAGLDQETSINHDPVAGGSDKLSDSPRSPKEGFCQGSLEANMLSEQPRSSSASPACTPDGPVEDTEQRESMGAGSSHSSKGEVALTGLSQEDLSEQEAASSSSSGSGTDTESDDEEQSEGSNPAADPTADENVKMPPQTAGIGMRNDIPPALEVNKGSGRNRTGVCEGVPRRRSYVRKTAAEPALDTAGPEGGHSLRPARFRPSVGQKRRYNRKNQSTGSSLDRLEEKKDEVEAGEDVDYLYGCTKCRWLKAGCSSCHHKPIMERSRNLRWAPSKARFQKGIEDAPTFYPTAEEFADPIQYIEKIRPQAERCGIACIVPPKTFVPPFALEKGTNGINSESFRFTVRKQCTSHLCMREPNTSGGKKAAGSRYRASSSTVNNESDNDEAPPDFGFVNLEKPYTLKSFHSYSDWVKASHYMSAPVPMVTNESGLQQNRKRKTFQYVGPEPSIEEQEAEFWRIVEDPDETVESLYGQDLDSGHHGSGFPLPPFRQRLLEQHLAQQAAAMREKSGHEAVQVNLPSRRFTPEEEEYACHKWNINNLPRNRGSVLRYIVGDELITGVMVPWLYVGSCMSAFCWHVEDHALYSVNYMHLGSPKVWYGVPANASEALEEAMIDALPHLFETAPDLLYQLVTLVSPVQLKARGVPVYRLVHREGTFVITFPNAYHAGFNTGFNVAEAVNFGPPDWLRWGTYIVEKYRREGRPATLSMDALLVSLVRAAPDVRKGEDQRHAQEQVSVRMTVKENGLVSVDIEGLAPAKGDEQPEVQQPAKRSAGSKDGKKYTLSALDPVNMEDVPPAAVRLGAGELALRIAKEKERQEKGLGELLKTIPKRRMHGKPGETDRDGLHINTDDVDCLCCKGDLYLTSVVSPDCPGVATCPEHAKQLPAADNTKILLYRFTLDELSGFLEVAKECIPGTAEAIEAAVFRDAHPEPQPVVTHLGPMVDVHGPPMDSPTLLHRKRSYRKRGGPEDEQMKANKKQKKRSKKRKPRTVEDLLQQAAASKKPRAPYGSKKAAREAAAAAAAAAAASKQTVPSRESRPRISRMKAQAIIADALAEADVEITDAALPEPRKRNPRSTSAVEVTQGAIAKKEVVHALASEVVSTDAVHATVEPPPPSVKREDEAKPPAVHAAVPAPMPAHSPLADFAKFGCNPFPLWPAAGPPWPFSPAALMAAAMHPAMFMPPMAPTHQEAMMKLMAAYHGKMGVEGFSPLMSPSAPGLLPNPLSLHTATKANAASPGGVSSVLGSPPAANLAKTSSQPTAAPGLPEQLNMFNQFARPFLGGPLTTSAGLAGPLASLLPNIYGTKPAVPPPSGGKAIDNPQGVTKSPPLPSVGTVDGSGASEQRTEQPASTEPTNTPSAGEEQGGNGPVSVLAAESRTLEPVAQPTPVSV